MKSGIGGTGSDCRCKKHEI